MFLPDVNDITFFDEQNNEMLAPPSVLFQELFVAMAKSHLFGDSKTVADLVPNYSPVWILREYRKQKDLAGFSLKEFLNQHFTQTPSKNISFDPDPKMSVRDYIASVWDILDRPADRPVSYSSLLNLPYSYVVPGGRFTEIYYWDSYFTMIGLYEGGKITKLRNMIKDMSSLIDRYGHIPNGNRTYYLSRSQPPFYALMISLLVYGDGLKAYTDYLPQLQREYDYWMDGEDKLEGKGAYRRVVRLADGSIMNRHWDDRDTPRDESYSEDIKTASLSNRPAKEVYRNLRAGAETGWDYSSRWLTDKKNLHTISAVDLLPIELNCLLQYLEDTLAYAYKITKDLEKAALYQEKAAIRKANIRRIFWSNQQSGFYDYNWVEEKCTDVVSAGMTMPLYLNIASEEQAKVVAKTVEEKLLKPGGIVASDQDTGQQWDAPNGWASLQWMAIRGFLHYGYDDLAQKIAVLWMKRVIAVYEKSGVLLEKYDVVSEEVCPSGGKGGGEYSNQIGFGWTNAILLCLLNFYPEEAEKIFNQTRYRKNVK